MIGAKAEDNTVVILSDDDEDEEKHVVNENGKRVYFYDTKDLESENEDEDEDDEEAYDEEEYEEGEVMYDNEDNGEEYEDIVKLSQVLPEDHESAILSERNLENPLQRLCDALDTLKSQVLKPDLSKDEVETSFAVGCSTKGDAPSVAMNIEGVVGPIAFPIIDKDADLILNAHTNEVDSGSCFALKTSHILLNQSFQEYVYQTILPDIYARLGVNQQVAENSRMEAIHLYICKEDSKLDLPKQHPKGSYASALLILPSEFGGGDIVAQYEEVSNIFRPEREAHESPFYIAWYNDVELDTETVTYGNQVSIYFSLIYSKEDESVNCESLQKERINEEACNLSPALTVQSQPYLETIASNLTSIPLANTKYPLFYMLNYSYNSPLVGICDLKKSDKVMANLMKKVAKETDYSLYIASLSREVEASLSSESLGDVKVKNNGDNEKDCPMDEEGIYLSENIMDDTLILSALNDENGVDLLAKPVSINFKEHQPIIQGHSWYSRCKPYSEEYNGGGSVDKSSVIYFYSNNTAIALIPKADTSLLKEPTSSLTRIV